MQKQKPCKGFRPPSQWQEQGQRQKKSKSIQDHTQNIMLSNLVLPNPKPHNHNQNPQDGHKNQMHQITHWNTKIRNVFLKKYVFTNPLKYLKASGIFWKIFDPLYLINRYANTQSNITMGDLFKEIIPQFCQYSNQTAKKHQPLCKTIPVMVNLLLRNHSNNLPRCNIRRRHSIPLPTATRALYWLKFKKTITSYTPTFLKNFISNSLTNIFSKKNKKIHYA